jgi:hypothetical protein
MILDFFYYVRLVGRSGRGGGEWIRIAGGLRSLKIFLLDLFYKLGFILKGWLL